MKKKNTSRSLLDRPKYGLHFPYSKWLSSKIQEFSDYNSWTIHPNFMFLGANRIVLMRLTDEKMTKTSHSHFNPRNTSPSGSLGNEFWGLESETPETEKWPKTTSFLKKRVPMCSTHMLWWWGGFGHMPKYLGKLWERTPGQNQRVENNTFKVSKTRLGGWTHFELVNALEGSGRRIYV